MPHQRPGNNGLDALALDRAAQVSRISSESHDYGELESLADVSRVLSPEELEATAVRRGRSRFPGRYVCLRSSVSIEKP